MLDEVKIKEYPKINNVYKRDEATGKLLNGQWTIPEFEYLANNQWEWSEKVDGMSIRVTWTPPNDGAPASLSFLGRTEKAILPERMTTKLEELFPIEKFLTHFPDTPLNLYGEGYGAKIQKLGVKYIPDGVSFILFDVLIGHWWLKREDVVSIATTLGIGVVPVRLTGTIFDAIDTVRSGLKSAWGDFIAEGLVGKPTIGLRTRRGDRIITKIKTRDFMQAASNEFGG